MPARGSFCSQGSQSGVKYLAVLVSWVLLEVGGGREIL